MNKIFKTEVRVIVLSEGAPVEFDSLSELDQFISYGDGIGQMSVGSHEEVPPEKVKDELFAIGNDGTFFETPREVEGDPSEPGHPLNPRSTM